MGTSVSSAPSAPASGELAPLVEALCAADGHEARSDVRDRIRALGSGAAAGLAAFLDHPDDFVRWDVVNLLGEWAAGETADAVLRFALTEEELHARWRSYWAVTRFDARLTVPPLLRALNGEHPERRWRAAVILSMLGREEAGPVLERGLRSPDHWTRWEALGGIRSLRWKPAARGVCRFLGPDHAPELRREAVLTLGVLATPRALGRLEEALDDSDPQVRWRAGMSLARNGPAAGPALRRRLSIEDDPDVIAQLRSDLARAEASRG